MKRDHRNLGLLRDVPFILTLLGMAALLLSPSPVAAQFTEIYREGPGSVRATWHGTPGSAYQVLTSTNLSAWCLFATPTAGTNRLFDVLDAIDSAPAKFIGRRGCDRDSASARQVGDKEVGRMIKSWTPQRLVAHN